MSTSNPAKMPIKLGKSTEATERFDRSSSNAPPRLMQTLNQAYAAGWSDARCVFVLSTGRVGTETLAAIFSLSPEVVAKHEPEPRLVKASFDAYMDGCSGEKWRDLVLAARDDFVLAANRQGKIYIETANRLTYLAPALALAFPAARFVHLHRHPYEVVRSFVERGAYRSHAWDFARIRPRAGEPEETRWNSLSIMEKIAWYWARVNGDAREFLQTLPKSKRFDLPADSLFRGDEAMFSELFLFAGAQLPPMNSIRDVLASKLNAQPRSTFPLSTEWKETDRKTIQKCVGSVAASLGYKL